MNVYKTCRWLAVPFAFFSLMGLLTLAMVMVAGIMAGDWALGLEGRYSRWRMRRVCAAELNRRIE